MNTLTTRVSGRLAAAALLLAVAPSAFSATITWGGSNGEYTVGANWVGGSLPNTAAGDTAHITAGTVTYTPGGDLALLNGGTLRVSGGSWTQAGGIAWIQMAGGNLLVDGGVFNQGTAGNIVLTSTSSITVSAGTANLNGNLLYNPTETGALTISGSGVVNVQNEFKPIANFAMTGGTLSANLISFADGPGAISLSGGTIRVNGAGPFSGFYGGGTQSVDFTPTSVGSLFFSSYSLTELNSDGFLTNGTIRLNGAVNAGAFTTWEADGGVYVNLVGAAIPEPSSFAALAGVAALGMVALRRRRV